LAYSFNPVFGLAGWSKDGMVGKSTDVCLPNQHLQ